MLLVLVEDGGLPAEGGAGDRDDPGGLVTLCAQRCPALVQSALGAPSDLDHTRVLAALAAGELLADRRVVAIVVGGFDQEPARVA